MSSCRFYTACCLIAMATTSLVAEPPRLGAGEKTLERQMKQRISISFENTPLKSVLDDLRDMHGINIVPDMQALDEAGVSLDSPISMKLERIALKSALTLILHQVELTCIIKDDVLQITTQDRARGKPRRVTYQVADLIDDSVPHWTDTFRNPKVTGEQLIDLFTKVISPRTWSVSGGKGTIAYSGKTGGLSVFQSPDVQEEVVDLVAALRVLRERYDAVSVSLDRFGQTLDLLGDARRLQDDLRVVMPLTRSELYPFVVSP